MHIAHFKTFHNESKSRAKMFHVCYSGLILCCGLRAIQNPIHSGAIKLYHEINLYIYITLFADVMKLASFRRKSEFICM